jgi:threonylcarbamoyladenosine tRNA methylthiotransferase MtaB
MNRKYNIKLAEEIINRFRKKFPDLSLSTDIIVGYPIETEQAHKDSMRFLKEFKPDLLNLSKFSLHKDTEIYNLINNQLIREIPIETINQRTTELMNLHKQTSSENRKKFLGKTVKVFVNNKREGFYEARDDNYNIVLINSKENILGKTLKVKITQTAVYHMIGGIMH